MKRSLIAVLLCGTAAAATRADEQLLVQLLTVKRVYVDRLGGGEAANHLRDMIIGSLQRSGLFVITENEDRADAILRGSAEDLIFTDTFQSSEGISLRASAGDSGPASGSRSGTARRSAGVQVGENESRRSTERKHEAAAAVRIVNKDGDVIWTTTQESFGAKFRGASADVADKIMRALAEDYRRAQRITAGSTGK